VVRHLRPDLGKLDAGYTAHPSFVDEEELKDMKGPLSIAAAETDQIFPNEKRHRTEDILKELKLPYQIKYVSSPLSRSLEGLSVALLTSGQSLRRSRARLRCPR
jgi:dienelactone hydrolase